MKNSLELNSGLDSVSSGPLLFRPGAAGLGSGHKWVVAARSWKVTMRPHHVQGEEKFTVQGSEAQLGLPLEEIVGSGKFLNSRLSLETVFKSDACPANMEYMSLELIPRGDSRRFIEQYPFPISQLHPA